MRLRRIELIFIGLTLAFVFFMGGFFTGRNSNSVNIEEFGSLTVETSVSQVDRAQQIVESQPDTTPNTPANNLTPVVVDIPNDNSTLNSNQEAPETVIIEPGVPTGGDGRININTASKNELMDLPGIGPALADNIVQYRNSNGTFRFIEDIMNVSGIGQGRFDRIKDKITV